MFEIVEIVVSYIYSLFSKRMLVAQGIALVSIILIYATTKPLTQGHYNLMIGIYISSLVVGAIWEILHTAKKS